MTKGLEYRIQQSIELLKKAEKLANVYDPENGFYLAFSGGKDSQALYHIAQMAGVKFKAHFSPTSVDPPQLIRFIKTHYPDVEFERLTTTIYKIAEHKFMPPTRHIRWCCSEFKEKAGVGKVTLIGIRHEESVKRSERNEVELISRKFSGTISEFYDYREVEIRKKYKHLNQDEFTTDKEKELRCIGGKEKIVVSPIIHWTTRDVWEFLNDVVKVPHCELYDPPYNQHRIGCILCPMSNIKKKRRDIELWPHVKKKWLDTYEILLRKGYFPACTDGIQLSKEEAFEWWISGLPFKKWYADYSHPKLFNEEEKNYDTRTIR